MPWPSHMVALCPLSCVDGSHTIAGLPVSQSGGNTDSRGKRIELQGPLLPCASTQGPGQDCPHTQPDSTQSGSCRGHTLFLGCALGQNRQSMQFYVSPEEKGLPHGTASTAITLEKHIISQGLSKSHTEYKMRRWQLTLWGQGPCLDSLGPA